MGDNKRRLGVIGGSGVYKMAGVEILDEHDIPTPFGKTSDSIIEAKPHHSDQSIFFLPRHGKNHHLLPSEVNYRGNIFALKTLGVTHILGINACGIMKEEIQPGDIVIPDQIFDRTKGIRPSTFFGAGIAGHSTFADPFCKILNQALIATSKEAGARVHANGTYLCIEGPQFSTRAESHYYRTTIAPAVIGMTGIPEAKLAREAELCYGMLAMATDYDCWHETEEDVSVEAVISVLKANATIANKIILGMAANISTVATCELCPTALQYGILTGKSSIPENTRHSLAPLYGKYLD